MQITQPLVITFGGELPAIRNIKHRIVADIQKIATEDLKGAAKQWSESAHVYHFKWRQAIEDRIAIEKELEEFETQLLFIDRPWNQSHQPPTKEAILLASLRNLSNPA